MDIRAHALIPNPLIKWPRNAKCICGSGKKFKLCHLSRLPRMVDSQLAADGKALLAKVFGKKAKA